MANLNVNIPATFEETVTAPHITGLETPTQPTDAANKQYVDDAVAGATPSGDYLPLAGGNMKPNAQIQLSASSHRTIIGGDIFTKSSETDQKTMSLTASSISFNNAGNTTTLQQGKLSGLTSPTNDNDAANKQYVDAAVAGGGGGVTFLGEGGTNTAHFFAFDLGSAVMLVGRFLSASFEPNAEFTVGIDLGVQPYSFDAMIPMTFYSTSNQSAGTIFTLMGTGSNTYLRCTANTTNFNGNGCFTAIFVK